jgi:hypothetical protein
MRILLLTACLLALSGCASINGIRDSSLRLEISPLPVLRGKPALAEVDAPLDAVKVTATVLVMGSPELDFRKDPRKGLWYFYGTIPFSPWVQPGTYKVRLMVFEARGKPRYMETRVDLK